MLILKRGDRFRDGRGETNTEGRLTMGGAVMCTNATSNSAKWASHALSHLFQGSQVLGPEAHIQSEAEPVFKLWSYSKPFSLLHIERENFETLEERK